MADRISFLPKQKQPLRTSRCSGAFFFFSANGGFMCLSPCQVSHALNVAYGVTNLFPDQLIYKTLHILDLPETDITLYVEECSCFIDQAREQVCTHTRGVKCINASSNKITTYCLDELKGTISTLCAKLSCFIWVI